MKRNLILSAICCMAALNLYAQRATDEKPYGLREGFRAQPQKTVVLPAPDMARIEKEDRENDQKQGPAHCKERYTLVFDTDKQYFHLPRNCIERWLPKENREPTNLFKTFIKNSNLNLKKYEQKYLKIYNAFATVGSSYRWM